MLEALSRFNVTVRANIKRDVNGASWPIWYGSAMGIKNTAWTAWEFRSWQSAPWTRFILHGGHAVSAWKVEYARTAIPRPDIFPCLCSSFSVLRSSFLPLSLFSFFFFFWRTQRCANILRELIPAQHTRAGAINDSANMFRREMPLPFCSWIYREIEGLF